MPSPQFVEFVFTLWIQSFEDYFAWNTTVDDIRERFKADKNIRYVSWQLEFTDGAEQPHVQGYIQRFGPQTLFGFIRDMEVLRYAHIEGARGTFGENKEYTNKVETRFDGPWSYGTPSAGGRPKTVDALATDLLADRNLGRVAAENPGLFVHHGRGLQHLLNVTDIRRRTWKTEVFVHWGAPGSGKTHDTPIDGYYLRRGNGGAVWWDGYDGESDVVIDDYYGWLPWGTILCLLDNRPMRVDVKGGSLPFCARRIYITSNRHPDQWYKYAEHNFDYEALKRRITECWHYTGSFSNGTNNKERDFYLLTILSIDNSLYWRLFPLFPRSEETGPLAPPVASSSSPHTPVTVVGG